MFSSFCQEVFCRVFLLLRGRFAVAFLPGSFVFVLTKPWEVPNNCCGITGDRLEPIGIAFAAPIVVLVSNSKTMLEKSNALTVACWERRHSNHPTTGALDFAALMQARQLTQLGSTALHRTIIGAVPVPRDPSMVDCAD